MVHGISISLTFDSVIARQQNSTSRPEDYIIKFNPNIKLPVNKNFEIGLVKFQGSYTWRNITAEYGNNLVRYSPDAGLTFKDVVFPDGVYTYSDIRNYIRFVMKENGDFTVVDGLETYDFDLQFSFATFLIGIQLTNGFQFEITTQSFGDLIGYDAGTLVTGSYDGARLPNINRSLDKILVHCSICHESYLNGSSSDVIYSFATASLSRGYPYAFEPNNIQFFPITGNVIESVRMYITDQFGTILNLNGIDTSVVLMIREN